MTFVRPTQAELIERGLADFETRMPGADARLRRSAIDTVARMHAGALSGAYGYLDWIARQRLPSTADAELLDQHGADWGVLRKAATRASGNVTLTGTNGAIAPADSLLVRSDGTEYRTKAEAVIALGTATVAVEAVETGEGGNAAAGQQLTFAAPIAGIGAQASATLGLALGNGEESDEFFRARLIDRIQQPPHGGSAADYRTWALEVPGVTRAWASSGELGLGTVSLRFVMDERIDIIPLVGDVDAVAAHIEALRPVTAEVHVLAPIAAPLAFAMQAAPPGPAVQAAIEEELRDLLRREAEPGGTLLISHIREAISLAAGEIDHEVTLPGSNVISATGYLPTFGSLTFL